MLLGVVLFTMRSCLCSLRASFEIYINCIYFEL